jgi:chaperone required for assembly of F1-ATPase
VKPRRFYTEVGTAEREGAYHLLLDGRSARTPGRAVLALPNPLLAELVAAEWRQQGTTIDAATMPMTRLANTAIDGVATQIEPVQDDIVRYGASDLVCYRADGPDPLVRAQAEAWDPILAWVWDSLGARFVLSEGVMFVQQPPAALARLREAVGTERSPFALAALHVMTTLTGSILLSLAQAAGRLGIEEAWQAAHVDEFYQESLWGLDDEAAVRRANRRREFEAACLFLAAARAR